ncbi:MAG: patatin-like phospholipase family protein [Anaerolineae bacterium]|nr:patatin-like phospholipase family protein [Anaerolineae bacterium]
MTERPIAFVLSGGGNRGALEVGALQALFEHGIKPDMLVGTSAGAMNAAFIATNPSTEGAYRLGDLWKSIRKEDIFPGNKFTMFWRLITGKDSLFPNDRLRRLVEKYIPPDKKRFGDLNVKLYITAANLNTATLYLFGEDPEALIADAVMASAAQPITFPPVEYNGWQFVDGGVVANVPIEVAIEKGAREIYAIDVSYGGQIEPKVHGLVNIGRRCITMMLYEHLLEDLEDAAANPEITLHHIKITAFSGLDPYDFSKTAEMIATGKRIAEEYLRSPVPGYRPEIRPEMVIPTPPGSRPWRRKRRKTSGP